MPYLSGVVAGSACRFPVPEGCSTLGRAKDRDIHVADRSVSRQHAELQFDGAHLRVRDVGSSNGTFLNGQSVQDAQLRQGDRVTFGTVELRVEDLDPANGDDPAATSAGDDQASLAASPAGAHATALAFAPPESLNTRARVGLSEARGDTAPESEAGRMLLRVLTEAGQVLAANRPLQETFDQVLAMVERITPSRRVFLLTRDDADQDPVVRAVRPAHAAGSDLMLSRTITRAVLEDREALLLNDIRSDPRFAAQESVILQNVRSAMVAPLFDNKSVIGLLYADSDDPLQSYDRDQLRAFALMANLIGVKITHARLTEMERERERIAQEMAAAAEVQRTLLPSTLPDVSGYQLDARQIPSLEVAGDLYDVGRLPDGRVMVVLGDVCGKGLAAAMLMSNVMAGLRVLCQEDVGARHLAERLHREVFQSSDELRFVTLFLGLLDLQTHRLEYVNAGHNPPLILAADGSVSTLDATGLPLGMLPVSPYESGTVELAPGSMLCLYSDGITEAERGEELFGEDRLLDSLRRRHSQPVAAIADGLLEDVTRHLQDTPAGDDVTLLLLKRLAEA